MLLKQGLKTHVTQVRSPSIQHSLDFEEPPGERLQPGSRGLGGVQDQLLVHGGTLTPAADIPAPSRSNQAVFSLFRLILAYPCSILAG